MNCIGYASYKTYFKDYLEAQSHRGAVGRLAEVLDCDRTYVSQVLYGKADFLPDHVARFCESVSLGKLESDYLMNLLLKNRSAKPKAREFFESRLEQIMNESTELSKKYKQDENLNASLSEEEKTTYYSNIHYILIHILTSIQSYQTSFEISKRLALPETEVQKFLNKLLEMKLIKLNNGKYLHSGKIIYLNSQAPQVVSLHLNTRLLSVQRSQESTDIHFTNVFSIGKEDMKKLKLQLSQVIDEFREKIHASGSEQIGIFCCDLFTP